MERKIVVFSTTSATKKTIITDARTWGELKSNPEVASLLSNGMSGVVKETKVDLNHNDAVLPQGDCTIFLIQQKTKAGITREQIKEMIMDRLEDAADEIADEIIDELKDTNPEAVDDDIEQLAEEARSFML